MQNTIVCHREDTGVTLISPVLQGTATHFGLLHLSCMHKAEDMSLHHPLPCECGVGLNTLSVAEESVSASMLKTLVNISLCNDRTVMHIYKVFW